MMMWSPNPFLLTLGLAPHAKLNGNTDEPSKPVAADVSLQPCVDAGHAEV